jgi:hypothetical protein
MDIKNVWLTILTAMCIGIFIGENLRGLAIDSRLKKVEAATYSAQQPKGRNYFPGLRAADTTWNPDCSTECFVHFVKK